MFDAPRLQWYSEAEEIFYPGDKYPLYLDKKSETLRVIQHMRNEAHRFGIKHHRSKRIKSTLQSELTSIKGIGVKTMTHLIIKYKSIKSIKSLTLEELVNEIGASKAKIIFENINKKEGNK